MGAVPEQILVCLYGPHLTLTASEDIQANGHGGPATHPSGRLDDYAQMLQDKDVARRDLRERRRVFVKASGLCQLRLHAIVIARIALDAAGEAKSVACYLANEYEVDAMPIIQLACARGIVTALPHIAERDDTMRFLNWQPGQRLVTGPYGIPQPMADAAEIAPDAIISPLVGFDRRGNRLGQGGGFYDRAFAVHPSTRRIGLAWSAQECSALPVDSWDQPLHAIVTERERIDFP